MKQIKKAGKKEFFIALLLVYIIITVFKYIKFIMPSYTVLADILCLIMLCVLGYLILIHYTAVFTYTINNDLLKLNCVIGKRRNKEIEFPLCSVISISSKKPDTKYIYNFSPRITHGKNTKYITFEHDRLTQAVLIETDDEMLKALKKFKKID